MAKSAPGGPARHNPGGPGMGGPGSAGVGAGGHLNADSVNSFLGTRANSGTAATRGQAIKNWEGQAVKPFSPGWYAQHPAAWHATHPHADVWAAATAAGVAAWLAVPYATVSGTPVYVTESDDETPAPVTNVIVNNATPESSTEPASETNTGLDAANAKTAGEWLSLGVFAVGPKNEKETSRVVQLEISKEGGVRGLFVDTVSGAEQTITGTVDKKTAQMRWQIGPKGVAFASPVGEFTKPQGTLSATLPDGKKAAWQVSQVKN